MMSVEEVKQYLELHVLKLLDVFLLVRIAY